MKNTILLFVILTALSCEIVPQIDICQHEVIEQEIIGSVTYVNDGISRTIDVIYYDFNPWTEEAMCEEAVICPTCGKISQAIRRDMSDYEHTFVRY